MSRLTAPSSWLFVAMKAGGGRRVGLRSARSRTALAEGLRRERLLLLRAWTLPAWMGRVEEPRLSLADQVLMNEQLHQLVSRGVPLVEALEVVEQTVRPRMRTRISKMREMVAAGTAFAEAASAPAAGGMDAVTCAVYRAGERTGDLAGAARQLGIVGRRTLAVGNKARDLMIYPIIVLCVGVLVAVGLLMGLMPRLGAQLSEMGPLPWFTRALVATGNTMVEYWPWLALLVAAALVGLFLVRAALLRLAGWCMRNVPILKGVTLAQESARFFATMAAMSRSGVPLADGLAVANQAIKHPQLRQQMERMRSRLVEGGLFRQLVDEVVALPIATRRLLVAAERSGDLESAFNQLSADMTDEVEKRAAQFLAVLQPAMVIGLFLIIGTMLVAILYPILTLASNVKLAG